MTLPIQKEERHKLQTSHNEELINEKCFSDGINQTSLKYNDWLVTVAFYVALHNIQTFLSKNNFKSTFNSHKERNEYLKYLAQIDHRIDKIVDKYLSLYKLSRLCRYSPCYFAYLKPADVQDYVNFSVKILPNNLKI